LGSVRANSLHCWSNFCGNGNDWCIEKCPHSEENGQMSCLAQYRRLINGTDIASYFGCHHVPCSQECVPKQGLSHSFSCCCSGDLCNSIPALTPTGDTMTPPTNPSDPPTVDPHDNVLACEEYTCGEYSNECYYGYQDCPPGENSFCMANYHYNASIQKYQLVKKNCTTVTEAGWCREDCHIQTGFNDDQFCCCSGDLCNQNVTFSDPSKVDNMIVDPCEGLGCHHSCIVHEGTPQCYCDYGHILSEDGKSCFDLDECKLKNGSCEVYCVNDIGTGHHCDCPTNQKLSDDGIRCEDTGLICYQLSCNITGIGCSEDYYENHYCDEAYDDPATNANHDNHHCQATYKLRDDGIFEPRLLSCFSGDFECTDDTQCVLDLIQPAPNIYHCCCKNNYCNGHGVIVFPSVTPPDGVTATRTDHSGTGGSSSGTAVPSQTATATPNQSSDKSTDDSHSQLIFIVVIILAVVVLIPVIAAGIGCIAYMYWSEAIHTNKNDQIYSPQEQEQLISRSPDVSFQNLTFIDKVGQGRFAAVYRAKNVEAEVAVKVFPNTQLSRESWTRECDIYTTPELEHKYILGFRGSLEKGSELWIVSDYYSLGSLHDLLKKQTLTLRRFCDLAESAAIGLAHLHDQRIVDGVTKKPSIAHRDLKSKNILIRNDFTCVISDFGLAVKFLTEETSTDAHGQVGTSRYMAPEVLEGAISFQREAYLRIDVYAFALVLWELASRTNLTNGQMKQYSPPFNEFVSPSPSIEEMREIVVGQFKRPTIAKGFTTSGEYDSIRDTIDESWDQEPEARLSAQCIAERIRMFKLSKFGSKDSGLTETDSPTDLTCNSESMDSQLAPTTPSLSSSRTMSPMTSKNCMLDSGTESLGIYPGQAFSTETVRLGGTNSSNSSFLLSSRSRGSGQFNPHHHFCGGGLSRCDHHHHHTAFSNRTMYNMHSTETTV
jgi:activin receptor type-2B